MDKFIVTSYYTINTQYQQVIHDYLMTSLRKVNVESDIRGVENLGSWSANTSYKPTFILQMLNKHPDKNIIFLDADAEILEYPRLFEEIPEEHNFAAHVLDRNSWYNTKFNDNESTELLSGTFFVRNNEESRRIINIWIQECGRTKEWEQRVLRRVLKECSVKLYELPLSYCYIKSLPNGGEPFVKCDNPIVVHNQVSRKLRNVIR